MKTLGLVFALVSTLAPAGCGGMFGNGKDETPPGPLVAATDPNVVLLEGALSNDLVPADQSSELIARVRVRTGPVEGAERPPINLALAIDTSGSMEGDPIEDARAAALAIVDELEPGDQLAVVVFHSRTEVLVPSTALTADNLAKVKADIGQMKASGTTDMTGGLSAAIQQAAAARKPDGVNRIVLLSDGVPNDETQILPLAQSAGGSGIAITALGLGLDYNETLLAGVAQTSGGTFHYIDDSAKVAGVFKDEVLRLERVVARNATAVFVPGPGVEILEVVGQQAQPSGGNRAIQVALGDISEGDERDLVLRLQVSGRRDGAPIELLDAVLYFQDTVANAGNLERRIYLSAHASGDADQVQAHRDADVERSLERARAAAAMVQAISYARSGQVDQGQQLLDSAQAHARGVAEELGDQELAAQADSMTKLRSALPAMVPQPTIQTDEGMVAPTAAEAPADAPETIRRSHDSAMRTLQGR